MTTTQHDTARRLTASDMIDRLLAALARTGTDHSTVKLSRNAKGDTQIEVSVRTDESECKTIEEARLKAQSVYDLLTSRYPQTNGG